MCPKCGGPSFSDLILAILFVFSINITNSKWPDLHIIKV
jgi:hypothetical protein